MRKVESKILHNEKASKIKLFYCFLIYFRKPLFFYCSSARRESVTVLGTLGILEQLFKGNYITTMVYKFCLQELKKYNGQEIRLPKSEIASRLSKLE